jgi:hypothetical protein
VILNIPLSDLPMASALLKMANLPEPPPDSGEVPQEELGSLHQPAPVKRPILHALTALGAGSLGLGAGTAVGYLGQEGLYRALGKQMTPSRVNAVVPVLSGLGALAYQQYQSRTHKELARALEAHQNKPAGAVPAK